MKRRGFRLAQPRQWLVVACLAWVGCTNEPTGPGRRGFAVIDLRPQFGGSGNGIEGSSSIGIPGDNSSANGGGFVDTFPLFTVPKNHFFEITVTGTISAVHTSNCTPDEGTEGTWDAFGYLSSQGRVNFTSSPNLGGIPTGSSGGSMILNKGVWNSEPTISVFRTSIAGTCNGGMAGLSLSGSQSIDWRIYPFFVVTPDRAVFTAGDSVFFEASSEWTTTGNFWKWRNNDTTATPGGSGRGSLQVCGSASTCKYAPSAPGRMYHVGTFPAPDGSGYDAPSPIVWKNSAPQVVSQLTTNDSSISRGDSIASVLRNSGAGGQLFGSTIHWRFEPDSVSFYDNGTTPNFAPPTVWDTVSNDSIWEGRVVHPGKLIATVIGPSNTSVDTVVITVSERGSPNFSTPVVVLDSPGSYNSVTLADPITAGGLTAGLFHLRTNDGNWPPDSVFTTDSIVTDSVTDGGPNHGYYFVRRANIRMVRGYSLNPWIDPARAPVYHAGASTTGYLIGQGYAVGVVDARSNAIMHERGVSVIAQDSHMERQNFAGADFDSCGNLTRAVERLVYGTSGGLVFAIDRAKTMARDAVRYASGHLYVYGFMAQNTPAVASWTSVPSVVTSASIIGDTIWTTNGGRPLPDTQYCDIHLF